MADTGTGTADTVAAYIDFDPARLEVVDTAGNPASGIDVNTTVFNLPLYNVVNNTAGQINFAASQTANPYLKGAFKAATIRFKAKAATPGTPVQFVRDGTRRSDLGLGGDRLGAVLTSYTVQVRPSNLDHFVYLPLLMTKVTDLEGGASRA